ncbi:sigma-70 family RNA polymerase sigma factor [Flavobacterium zepuense]|uniref:Sigma-70 family RNA polymerase sigma factor n=1 Tax=Flavobacterium zepuense TaxID=2593302 RepID=A0A552UTE8_9FLAO|nr:sigma-70 family RNA polymerase sigma factor [Flavobacterium zepuense]TRW21488.1 sigma-70 family RNA polymerase sigma factor [Flavobacterium zepuense]
MKLVPLHDELDLIVRLRDGDHAAFEEIYHLYKAKMIANALRLLKSRELAEELLQNLFLKVWEQRTRIDTTQPLNAFLYKVAQNMAYDLFRKVSRDKKLQEHLIAATITSYDHIEKHIFRKENLEELNKALSLLPPQQQKVFTLCKLEDKSYEEAGRILNITPGTINNHMHRANLFLKEYFSRRSGIAVTFIASVICESL